MRLVSSVTPYWIALNHLPDRLGRAPWVRCPPEARSIPRIVSPGLMVASITAWFACAPEWGCTFACLHPNSSHARSMASRSAVSTCSQPP